MLRNSGIPELELDNRIRLKLHTFRQKKQTPMSSAELNFILSEMLLPKVAELLVLFQALLLRKLAYKKTTSGPMDQK